MGWSVLGESCGSRAEKEDAVSAPWAHRRTQLPGASESVLEGRHKVPTDEMGRGNCAKRGREVAKFNPHPEPGSELGLEPGRGQDAHGYEPQQTSTHFVLRGIPKVGASGLARARAQQSCRGLWFCCPDLTGCALAVSPGGLLIRCDSV